MLLGLALRDTISGTRLMEQVPIFPTRSRPTKITLGLQQSEVKEAEMDLLTAPWLKASTEKNNKNCHSKMTYFLYTVFSYDVTSAMLIACERRRISGRCLS